jgi:hypothetical protein
MFTKQTLYTSSPFCSGYFRNRVSWTIIQAALNLDLPNRSLSSSYRFEPPSPSSKKKSFNDTILTALLWVWEGSKKVHFHHFDSILHWKRYADCKGKNRTIVIWRLYDFVCRKSSKSAEKLWEIKSEITKICGYKINIQIKLFFYTLTINN